MCKTIYIYIYIGVGMRLCGGKGLINREINKKRRYEKELVTMIAEPVQKSKIYKKL